MGITKKRLQRMGYNLRERANIYVGTAVGLVAPIIAARYLTFPISHEGANPILAELVYWGGSIAMNAAALYPILLSTAGGVAAGLASAESLRNKRLGWERRSESPLAAA